jgi:hypothetical protein
MDFSSLGPIPAAFANYVFQISLRILDVFHLPGAGYFPLGGDGGVRIPIHIDNQTHAERFRVGSGTFGHQTGRRCANTEPEDRAS